MKRIKLSQGKEALICDCHYHLVSSRKWSYKEGYAGYSRRSPSVHLSMHRLIMGAKVGELVDHINRDKLDNRCSNLRIVSFRANIINRGVQRNNTSGYAGVQYRKDRKKWFAIIGDKGRYRRLGSFSTPEEAYVEYLHAKSKQMDEVISGI